MVHYPYILERPFFRITKERPMFLTEIDSVTQNETLK